MATLEGVYPVLYYNGNLLQRKGTSPLPPRTHVSNRGGVFFFFLFFPCSTLGVTAGAVHHEGLARGKRGVVPRLFLFWVSEGRQEGCTM